MRRLLVGVSDEADAGNGGVIFQKTSNFNKDGNCGRIIVGSDRARDRIVVGTDDKVRGVVPYIRSRQSFDI